MNCPFCSSPLQKEQLSFLKDYNLYKTEIRYSCESDICKLATPLGITRFSISIRQPINKINYYQACLPFQDGYYILQGSSAPWTRLYTQKLSLGAFTRPYIIELPVMLPMNPPYLPAINSIMNKLFILIPFL